jgi:hypothetical protein
MIVFSILIISFLINFEDVFINKIFLFLLID